MDNANFSDNRFNRFDQELIDKYFNDAGKKAIQDRLDEAYRKGYNDNARDCYCDGSEFPHKHLADDGLSHSIRPDFAQLKRNK